MANTYTQINIHCVFAVKGRENLLDRAIRDRVHQYISGIIRELDSYPLAVGGWLDHVHVFLELNPNISISQMMQKVKANSTKMINNEKLVLGKFEWQSGYGAFSHSKSQRYDVIKYIMNQELHHSKVKFKDEYLEMLHKFNVDFDEKYLFEF
jgi:REP element-mobilizing transposase RayT